MKIEDGRNDLDRGIALARMLSDMVHHSDYSQGEVAMHLGVSDSQMSCILAPMHQASFSIVQLPAVMRLFDSKAILKTICGWAGMMPVAIPNGKARVGELTREVGELLVEWGRALEDGRLTMREAETLRSEARDILAVIEGYIAEHVERI